MAKISSRNFRLSVRSGERRAVLTSCWVIVDPPSVKSEQCSVLRVHLRREGDFKVLKRARRIPLTENPRWE